MVLKQNLVRPENRLRFRELYNKYMDHIVLQLEDIRKPGKIETEEAKVTIFQIYQQNLKEKLGSKERCLVN